MNNNDSAKDSDSDQELIARVIANLKVNTNTLAILATQVMELGNDFRDSLSDTSNVRMAREQKEIAALQIEFERVKNLMEVAKTAPTSTPKVTTSQKIRLEMQKGQINWIAVRQAMVTAAAVMVTIAISGAVFWGLVKLLAGVAP